MATNVKLPWLNQLLLESGWLMIFPETLEGPIMGSQ
jgi:hypothetical protein